MAAAASNQRSNCEQGILTRSSDPSHKQKAIYSLTEQGIELLPVLGQMSVWGQQALALNPDDYATACETELVR